MGRELLWTQNRRLCWYLLHRVLSAMTSYVLDKLEIMKPAFSYSTEYDTKYNRQLWDSATRTHFFQLSMDRRRRMLEASKHAPIHWDSEPEDVECISSRSVSHHQKSPKGFACQIVSPEPPKKIKSAWSKQSSPTPSTASDFLILEENEAYQEEEKIGLKRSNSQRSPTPSNICEDRKRLRTPSSKCELQSRPPSMCRPKSAPSCRLNVHNDYSRPSSQNSRIRPDSFGSGGRLSTRASRPSSGAIRPSTQTHSSASDYTKLPSAFGVRSGASVIKDSGSKCKKSHTKQASAPFALYGGQSETARSHEMRDRRVKDAARGLKGGFRKVGSNKLLETQVDMADLPRDIRLWVTEYQGNFKSFNPI